MSVVLRAQAEWPEGGLSIEVPQRLFANFLSVLQNRAALL